jgi:hypothetical protein
VLTSHWNFEELFLEPISISKPALPNYQRDVRFALSYHFVVANIAEIEINQLQTEAVNLRYVGLFRTSC